MFRPSEAGEFHVLGVEAFGDYFFVLSKIVPDSGGADIFYLSVSMDARVWKSEELPFEPVDLSYNSNGLVLVLGVRHLDGVETRGLFAIQLTNFLEE